MYLLYLDESGNEYDPCYRILTVRRARFMASFTSEILAATHATARLVQAATFLGHSAIGSQIRRSD